jgi:hypothetical protein
LSRALVNLTRADLAELNPDELTAVLSDMTTAADDLRTRTRERAILGFRDGEFGHDLDGLNATLAELGLEPHMPQHEFSANLSITVELSGPASPADFHDQDGLHQRLRTAFASADMRAQIHDVLVAAAQQADQPVKVASDVSSSVCWPEVWYDR